MEAGHFGDYQKQKILEINELLLGFGKNLAVSTKILQEPLILCKLLVNRTKANSWQLKANGSVLKYWNGFIYVVASA